MRWGQGVMARSLLVGAFACLALLLVPSAGAQDSAKKYSIDIPQQALTPALAQLSVQTGINYGYIPETPEQEQTQVGPVRGEYTIDEALTQLLRTTGLTFSRINSRNIAIVRAAPPPPKVEPKPKPPRAAQRPMRAMPREEPAKDVIIDEVFSEASKYRYLPAPSAAGFVLDREEIEHAGAPTIMDLLKLLPQQPFLRPDGFRSNGAQYAELRGLGADTTQVLLNGQRAFASAASFTVNAFDLNQVPLSAVERVEVQLDSISVRHGADAIGGIVNVVLRDDIPDPSVEVRYGTAAGGGEERQAALSAGYGGEDARAALILDYRDVAPLYGAERDLWRDQDYRRFGSIDQRSTISSPGNVMAPIPGSLLPGMAAPFAAIPERTAGPITGLDEFLPLQLNRESLLQYFSIVAEDRRASAVASAQASITPDLVAAVDLMIVDRRVSFAALPPVVTALVPQTNPYSSFAGPVIVTELLEGVDSTLLTVDSLLIRGAGSLRGRVKNWDWELSLLRSEEDAQQRIDNVVDPARLARVLADPDPDRTLNLLGPGPAASPEILASVLAPPDIERYAADATQLMGVVSGNLFAMPAGDVFTVLGTEWRTEAVQFDALLGSFEREVSGGFAELHVPLLDERMQLAAARELTMTVAGRFDRYSDFGEIFSPQYGLVWKPLRPVEIRGTYGRSFRPPSLYDLHLPRVAFPGLIADPRRNGEQYSAMMLGGGAPDLEATRGESFTAGIELTPEAIKPLALSATYWHVKMDNRVTALNSTFALLHEADVADHILRAEPTAADVAAGLPGRVLQIDTTRINFGRLTTSGIDLGASYALDSAAGHFAPDVKATWIHEYEALDLPGLRATDRVDVANALGTIAKWRAVASLDWQRGALGASAYARYIPSYADTRDGVRNGRTVPSQTFLDLQFSVNLGKLLDGSALLRGLQLTVGALNALDQQPHFAEVNGIQGYDTSQGDLEGRFWYLRLGKAF
jgi:iron complex outermembrane recepter protein